MDHPVIIIVGIAAAVLITFLVIRNIKDARRLKNQLNRDYHKPRDNEGDIEIEESVK